MANRCPVRPQRWRARGVSSPIDLARMAPNACNAADAVGAECDAGPRHLTIVEYRPPWRQGRWQRMDAVPDHPAPLHPGPPGPGRFTGGAVTLRFHLSDELEPSPDIGGLLREIDRDPITIFWVIARPGRGVHAVPVPDCAVTSQGLPGILFPQGYERFWDLMDWARSSPETRRPRPRRSGSG